MHWFSPFNPLFSLNYCTEASVKFAQVPPHRLHFCKAWKQRPEALQNSSFLSNYFGFNQLDYRFFLKENFTLNVIVSSLQLGPLLWLHVSDASLHNKALVWKNLRHIRGVHWNIYNKGPRPALYVCLSLKTMKTCPCVCVCVLTARRRFLSFSALLRAVSRVTLFFLATSSRARAWLSFIWLVSSSYRARRLFTSFSWDTFSSRRV